MKAEVAILGTKRHRGTVVHHQDVVREEEPVHSRLWIWDDDNMRLVWLETAGRDIGLGNHFGNRLEGWKHTESIAGFTGAFSCTRGARVKVGRWHGTCL